MSIGIQFTKEEVERRNAWLAGAKEVPVDAVNPAHYRSHPSGVECIQITEHMNFNLGNATKYIWRSSLKGARQLIDAQCTATESKAVWVFGLIPVGFPAKSNVMQRRAKQGAAKESKAVSLLIGVYRWVFHQVQSNAKHGVAEQCTAKRCNAAHRKAKR
jgi:hypothetical protein